MEKEKSLENFRTETMPKNIPLNATGDSGFESEEDLQAGALVESEKAKIELAKRRLPLDPKGAVSVLFFFRPKQDQSRRMLKTLETLKDHMGVEKVSFSAFTVSKAVSSDLGEIKEELKLSYPVLEGVEVSEQLKIAVTPSVAVVAATTGEMVIEQGEKSAEYLAELIRRVQGGK
jgi:hypothetical protein